ncbi:helix-turn-helix domain-containing protein [Streptomyces sp. NBC_00237]|uniref:helix-turn-helix domain-containing protein n=1 Tax=Streptomyces sp. NBC_00237 TaxID=2975687 RepID=UPI002252E0FA|nr:helix-turn-helix transcriptional regulator [Streptomyces sp. NBC_00237]MCX5206035.1 helix-turn-helix domain-containing protein [Streptomyces sp. NBC_00237]
MLGKELRALRERKGRDLDGGLSIDAAAKALGFSRAKLSRIESGEIPLPKLGDLKALLEMYEVTGRDDQEELLQMQRDSLKSEPITSYRNYLPSGMPRYLGLERDSAAIRGYENYNVHGLLQTEEYAWAQMLSAKVIEERTTDQVQSSVRARMERKELLDGERQVHIIMTENVLRTLIGTPEVMRGQFAEIKRLCTEKNVEVQVIPEDLPNMYRGAYNFTILEFHEVLDPVVQSDSHKATTMWDTASDVGFYERSFNAMAKAAPGPSYTAQILDDLEEKLWK